MSVLIQQGAAFNRYLKARKPPIEPANLKIKMHEIEELVMSDPAKFKLPKFPTDPNDESAMKNFNSRKRQKVQEIINQRVYKWESINYDAFKSLLYLLGRSVQEYAVLKKIFSEIQRRDPEFKPNSYFDFGSGVGTGVWASSELWKSSIYEYYLVDSSRFMNDLSDLILRDGNVNKSMTLRNVNYRQFIPAAGARYDIVLSAYSMFELPNLKSRLEAAHNLWKKAENYLIFVEQGTNAGFQVLNEIREFLMTLRENSSKPDDSFIFAPCTHEKPICPKFQLQDGTPCNFSVSYETYSFYRPIQILEEKYCYLVIKKGSQPTEQDRWPRLVSAPLLRHKHVICRMCTESGELHEGIFTKRVHGQSTYRCAKSSKSGDQLPVSIVDGGTILSKQIIDDDDEDDTESDSK